MITDENILVDSFIINNLLSKQTDLQQKSTEFISKLEENNKLYASEFSAYEILRTTLENKVEASKEKLKIFTTIPLSKDRLDRATKLYSAYKLNDKTKNHLNSISDIDIFIGSIIFTDKKGLLLTADFNDFPRPFFREKAVHRIEYKRERGGLGSIYYYLLEANLESIF